MATRPLPQADDSRYPAYIHELREFFATSHLPCGSPEDLDAVIQRLAEPSSFSEDLSSLVRSIVLREGGAMPHAQLLEILALAIAGPEIKDSPEPSRQPLRHLLAFITEAMHRPWNVPPSVPATIVPFPSEPAAELEDTAPLPSETLPQPHRANPEFSSHPSAIGAALADRHREPSTPNPQRDQAPASSAHPPTEPPQARSRRSLILSTAASAALIIAAALGWHAFSTGESYRVQPAPNAPIASAQLPPARPSAAQPFTTAPIPIPAPARSPTPALIQPTTSHNTISSRTHLPTPPTATSADTQTAKPQPAPRYADVPPQAAPPQPTPYDIRRPLDPDASIVGDSRSTPHRSAGQPTSRFTVSSGVMAANLISGPDPTYPTLARLTGVEGQVILQAVVAQDGTVSATHILRGPRLLRGAAQDAVRRWRYRPYRVDGRPVDVATIVTLDFHH